MRYNANEVPWEVVTVLGRTMLFSGYRISRSTVPEGLYMYEVRHADDDWGDPCEVAEGILVNFFGKLLSKEGLPLKEIVAGSKPYLELNSQEDWGYEGVECTLKEFVQDKNRGTLCEIRT